MSPIVRYTCAVIIGATAVAGLRAQEAARPRYEVVSVRPSPPDSDRSYFTRTPGRLSATNATLRSLIVSAFEIPPQLESYLLIGGDKRLMRSRYDIAATTTLQSTSAGENAAMLQELLKDRFGLRTHVEMRPTAVYALRVASPGRLGPSLARSKYNCVDYAKEKRANHDVPEPLDAAGRNWCVGMIGYGTPEDPTLRRRGAGTLATLIQQVQAHATKPPEFKDPLESRITPTFDLIYIV